MAVITGAGSPDGIGFAAAGAAPRWVAAAIAWLASPGASYVTGQYLVVDGGNSIAEERTNPARS